MRSLIRDARNWQSEPTTGRPMCVPLTGSSGDGAMQNPLEAYLQQVERRLRSLPREQRTQEIDELRRHLESLIDARIEAGLSEQEAVTEAIRQFGEPKGIGKSLVRTWRRAHRSFIDNLLVAPIIMLFLRLLTCIAGWWINWMHVDIANSTLTQNDLT